MHCGVQLSVCISEVKHCGVQLSVCISEVKHCGVQLSVCISEVKHCGCSCLSVSVKLSISEVLILRM